MTEITLDRFIEALEHFLQADLSVDLCHLNRLEAAFLLDQIRRLQEYDANEELWSRGRSGASVTDCIGWLYLQKKQAESERDMAANMNSRMFQAVIDHLQELHGRRQGADRAKAEERQRREAEAKKADEARKTKSEQKTKGPFEERMRQDQWEAFFYGSGGFGGSQENAERNAYETFRRWNWGRDPPKSPSPGTKQRWWEVLGVSPEATRDQITKAYRKLAAKYHPDRKGGSAERMQAINVARDEGLAGLPGH